MPTRPTNEMVPLRSGAELLHRVSRFVNQPLFLEGNRKFWGTWKAVNIPTSPLDTYITITDATEAHLDLIAYGAYKSPELWWILAEANDIFFPFEELATGTIIRIPSYITVTTMGLIR